MHVYTSFPWESSSDTQVMPRILGVVNAFWRFLVYYFSSLDHIPTEYFVPGRRRHERGKMPRTPSQARLLSLALQHHYGTCGHQTTPCFFRNMNPMVHNTRNTRMIIVHACTVIIVQVSCPVRLMHREIKDGCQGAKPPTKSRGFGRLQAPPWCVPTKKKNVVFLHSSTS